MVWSFIGFALLAAAVVLLAQRERIVAWLDRLEARQATERARIAALRRHPHGHMALTIEEIAARTPPVELVWATEADGTPNGRLKKRYVWGGEAYDLHDDAQAARMSAILDEARSFYVDLDQGRLTSGGPSPQGRGGTPGAGPAG